MQVLSRVTFFLRPEHTITIQAFNKNTEYRVQVGMNVLVGPCTHGAMYLSVDLARRRMTSVATALRVGRSVRDSIGATAGGWAGAAASLSL
jgi:hypothetical protein